MIRYTILTTTAEITIEYLNDVISFSRIDVIGDRYMIGRIQDLVLGNLGKNVVLGKL